ncbi:hypothetical protein Tco_0252194 [Tanacetum coccineum]
MLWRHQNSSIADPPPTGVRAEDIYRLCENIIELQPVLPAMLYEIGLTRLWKHVGHHRVLKMVKGMGNSLTNNEDIVQHTTPLLSVGALIPEKSGHQKVVEHEDAKVLAAKRKAQVAKDKTTGKRSAAERTSHRTKKKKTAPMSFSLSESKADNSNRSGFGTHHSAWPLNTIIPGDTNPIFGGSNLALESITRTEDDTCNSLNKTRMRLCHDERDGQARRRTSGSTGDVVSSSSGGSGRHVFPQRNPGGDGVGSSLWVNVSPPAPFILDWNLTTHSILNDVESCQDMMLNLATHVVRDKQNRLSDHKALQRAWFELGRGALAQIDLLQQYEVLNDDYGELYQSHRYCKDVSDRLTDTQNQQVDAIRSRNTLSDDHKTLQQEHLGCVGKEVALTEKLAATEKEKYKLLDKNREQEEQIRHNYIRQLLPTFVERLISSDEYKKSLSDVFNQAIAAGWSEGVKAERYDQDAEAILATAADYDPECKSTFMPAFDALFIKRYPYVEKLAESFRLLLGDL